MLEALMDDGFDLLPDSLILLIFNAVSDAKTLIRCRSVCKRFNSLAPLTELLLLRIDRVISPDSDSDCPLFSLLRSLLNFLFSNPAPARSPASPAQILSRFLSIRELRIELPPADHGFGKGTVVRWRAEFGEVLKTCVILGFRSASENSGTVDPEFSVGLKMRVVWTISALISASVRHFLLKDVIRDHEETERIVIGDRDGEGTVVMERDGLREWRQNAGELCSNLELGRTVVPCVRMRMRQDMRSGATLVVAWAAKYGDKAVADADLAMKAFGDCAFEETVRELLKCKSYLLEMNSF